MEEDGFTLVEQGDDNIFSKKSKAVDGVHTTMLGISKEEAENIYKETLKRGRYVMGAEADEM